MPWASPPAQPSELPNWIRAYLSPRDGLPAHRAHLFTINGYTYPFVRDFNFACVPDPPETSHWMSRRRFSMLAGLFGTRPGDLMFFFQGDPQFPKDDIESRRGFRGIYRVVSSPFRDTTMITHPQTGYQIHGECPSCHKPFATLGEECKLCGRAYPEIQVRAVYRRGPSGAMGSFRVHVLSARMLTEPVAVFARTLGDNRGYMDMRDPGLIWISRADNAMGAGKGSSIRHILPEEAIKLTRLLFSEPEQEIISPQSSPYPSQSRETIRNDDGTESIYPRLLEDRRTLQHELHLNLHIARTIDMAGALIQEALGDALIASQMEYWGSELPWGYTADTADFVCTLRDGGSRYRLLIFEFKRDDIDDNALVEVMLYSYWVPQICTQFAEPPVTEVEVVPVLIGRRNTLTRLPQDFEFPAKYLVGPPKTIRVLSPRVLEYSPTEVFQNPSSGRHYARDLHYIDVTEQIGRIEWKPPEGVATTSVEREWVEGLWNRRAYG